MKRKQHNQWDAHMQTEMFMCCAFFSDSNWSQTKLKMLGQQATPAGFEPARAKHNGLAGHRLNHSAKVSLCLKWKWKFVGGTCREFAKNLIGCEMCDFAHSANKIYETKQYTASMAQSAEHSAVNRRVPGSSPGGSVWFIKKINDEFNLGLWSSGMILALGARGREFNSRQPPIFKKIVKPQPTAHIRQNQSIRPTVERAHNRQNQSVRSSKQDPVEQDRQISYVSRWSYHNFVWSALV